LMTVILEDFFVIPRTGYGEPCECRIFEKTSEWWEGPGWTYVKGFLTAC
jgi:hypothetical protein